MKKQFYIALLLVLVFLALLSMPTLAANTQAAYAKISDELLTAFSNSEGRVEVAVWLEDESTEEYQSIVANIPEPDFSSGNNDASVYSLQNITETELSEEERLAQIEQMQNYIMQKRQIAQAVYLADNNAVAQELEAELDGGEIVYISRYSSLILFSINLSEAVDIAMSNSVSSLSYNNDIAENELQYSLPTVDAMSSSSFPQYSAAGIKIGMIEPNIPDTSRACFDGIRNKIVTTGTVNEDYDHADFVAAIIVNAAPDFEKLYCVTTSSFYSNIENLITNGVNVINMSAGYNKYDINAYDNRAKWIDHIVYNHSVYFVKSAGNESSDHVSSPGMAYNAIIVGNINDADTVSTVDDVLVSSSSYNFSYDDLAFKPDLCAPGNKLDIPNDSGFYWIVDENTVIEMENTVAGTSLAAPHVTGIVASLCSYHPELMTKPALMKSILMNSVSAETTHRYDTTYVLHTDSGFRKYGAGIINAHNAKLQIDSENYINTTISASATSATHNIGTVQAGETVSITLVFLKNVSILSGSHTSTSNMTEIELPRLNLYIRDANAPAYVMHIMTNEYNNNSVQRIIFTATTTTEYTIGVAKVGGDSTVETEYAVSWMIDNDNLQ